MQVVNFRLQDFKDVQQLASLPCYHWMVAHISMLISATMQRNALPGSVLSENKSVLFQSMGHVSSPIKGS